MSTSFSQFIAENGIIATTAGIVIGFSTATFIKSLVADVIMPLIFLVLVRSAGKNASFFTKYLSNKDLMLTNFLSEFITWVLILIFAWVVLGLAYKYLSDIKVKIPPVFGQPAPVVSQEQNVQSAPKPVPWY